MSTTNFSAFVPSGTDGSKIDQTKIDEFKQEAADNAAGQLQSGMIVGLGSGTTATLAVASIGRRVQEGLQIIGIPTSEKTADQARHLKIPLSTLEEHFEIDITIDGADEVETGTLNLIKGGGGNLLREKIVAVASKRMIVVADERKLVDMLGMRGAVPVEVVPFGWKTTAKRLEHLGANPTLRLDSNGGVYITDGGNYILDCRFPAIPPAAQLQTELDHVVGVVEHGLFVGIASQAIVGGANGVKDLLPESHLS